MMIVEHSQISHHAGGGGLDWEKKGFAKTPKAVNLAKHRKYVVSFDFKGKFAGNWKL